MKNNTAEVANLQPDYLGFIFYDKSPRIYDLEEISSFSANKVGVFVNASVEDIMEKVEKFNLNVIQLHGEESPEFCKELKPRCQAEPVEASAALSEVEVPGLSGAEVPVLSGAEVWKVFSIKDTFNFSELEPYESFVDKFLFDTKGKEKGGNGYTFDWSILKNYPSKKPFILSGGIGLEEVDSLKEILKTDLPIYAIDVNSKFETEPGLKDVGKLGEFMEIIANSKEEKRIKIKDSKN